MGHPQWLRLERKWAFVWPSRSATSYAGAKPARVSRRCFGTQVPESCGFDAQNSRNSVFGPNLRLLVGNCRTSYRAVVSHSGGCIAERPHHSVRSSPARSYRSAGVTPACRQAGSPLHPSSVPCVSCVPSRPSNPAPASVRDPRRRTGTRNGQSARYRRAARRVREGAGEPLPVPGTAAGAQRHPRC